MFFFFLRIFLFFITLWPFCIRTFGSKMTNFTTIKTFKRKLTFELVGSSFQLSHNVGLLLHHPSLHCRWSMSKILTFGLSSLSSWRPSMLPFFWMAFLVPFSFCMLQGFHVIHPFLAYLECCVSFRVETLESNLNGRDLIIFWTSFGLSTFSPIPLMVFAISSTKRKYAAISSSSFVSKCPNCLL